MDAKKCDRCGNYFDNTNIMNTDLVLFNGIIKSVNMQHFHMFKVDHRVVDVELCPDCAHQLVGFLEVPDSIVAVSEIETGLDRGENDDD